MSRRPRAPVAGQRLLSQVAAWYVADILCQALPPANAKPGLLCYKTGTSYGFRDAWSVGFDGRYVIAVWVGRPDGATTPGLTGRTTAAPLLFDAFARVAARRTPMPPAPSGALRVANADLPPPLKRFREGAADDGAAGGYLEPAVKIAFPPDRSEIEVEDGEAAGVTVKAEGGALPLTWLLDGEPIASDPQRREVRAAGGRARLLQAVGDRRPRTRRPRHDQVEVVRAASRPVVARHPSFRMAHAAFRVPHLVGHPSIGAALVSGLRACAGRHARTVAGS